IEEMGDNLHQHSQNSTKKLSYFSLALDKSGDVCDSAQLLIFIRGMNMNIEVAEELAALQSIKGTTTGEDIYEKVCQTVNGLELDWTKLASGTTDGAPSMVGSKKGVITHINQKMDKHNHSHPIAIHCLIHQQVLCRKSLMWSLSFYDLLPQITAFLLSQNKEVPELNDAEWKWHLTFLTDVTELLNSFNVQFQGNRKFVCDMQSHGKAFEVKLGLPIKQVKEENFCHLPTTQNLLVEKPLVAFPNKTCVESLEKLQKEFQFRFKELHLHKQDIQLFHNPFSTDIENVDTMYQMELAELQ
uniref:DUF4371 domain-containing protein n=1 Tax=Otolemur garnettii TaxID=30611 RepID=H0XX58_OTOGA